MTSRLSLAGWASIAADILRPRFDPRALGVGIVHLGCGAFHRGHQAVHTQAAIEARGGDWGIAAVSMRGEDVPRRLAPQDGLYSVMVRESADDRICVVGAIRAVIGPGALADAITMISRPTTRVVSLTVTEKGYCRDAASGALDGTNVDILADLATPERPRSAPGLIVAGLAARRASGQGGLAVMSCDNLAGNGEATSRVIVELARRRDPALADWIERHVTFPSTMVDRIVPATTPADIDAVSVRLGLRDEACVVTEPFTQWVIEDRFPAGRPVWEDGGAELVADVAPYELMKLRLINASSSLIAYLGYLAGHETVSDALAAPGFAGMVGRLFDEAAASLRLPQGTDARALRRRVVERFANPQLRHRTWQICMDGSQKLPQRFLGTLRDNLAAGRPIRLTALGVAAWMRYVRGRDEKGAAIDVRDPLAGLLARHVAGAPAARADALLAIPAIFGDDLRHVTAFRASVLDWLDRLERDGAAAVVLEAARPN
ncbi:MAG: mannitol dehydrogenase family protein [Alphaproteobacteria bacterium]|nr:mannitol dehydrogenase family protein [Alphaproteobacteria bacterium]